MSDETKKNIILAVLSSLISLLFFVVVAEAFLGFRYEQWRSNFEKNGDWYGGLTIVSDNPKLIWEYRSNAESDDPGFPKIRTNRYGFRDHNYETIAKQPGVFRIAFIGDSVTLGLKVDIQNTFVRKFEEYANENHSDLQIQSMNFGIDGYNANQIFELLVSRVLLFRPDNIVYVMCLNDFDFNDSSGGKIRYFREPTSFVLEDIERRYRNFRKIDYHLWHYEKNKQLVFDKIVEMKQLILKQNIDFQIVLLPVFEFEGSNNSFITYPLSEVHMEIRRFMTEEHIDFIDLLKAFRTQKKPPEYFASDVWHPNNEGHDFIAKKLLKPLLREIGILNKLKKETGVTS